MRKVVENILQNEQISDRTKELLKEDFEKMFALLDKKGFTKWVKFQRLAEDAKTLVVDEEGDATLNPNHSGEYNEWLNKIILRKKDFSDKKEISEVSTHESYHLFSRFSTLPTYIKEGVTQYLTALTNGTEKENNKYKENTQFIAFLTSFLGDSVIKSYFTGNIKYFEKDLHNLLSEEVYSSEERDKIIENFFYNLDRVHETEVFQEYEEQQAEDDIIDLNSDKLNEVMSTLIGCKFKQMARNRCFNKDGKVDKDLVVQAINEKLKYYQPFEEIGLFSETKDDGIFENDEKDLEYMVDNLFPMIERNYNPKMPCKNDIDKVKYFQENYKLSDKEVYKFFNIDKMIGTMSIIEFSDYVTNIASKFNIPEDELKELNKKYLFRCLDIDTVKLNRETNLYEEIDSREDIYDIIIENVPRNKAVFDLLSSEVTSTESKFRKIGDSEYVEQRDGEFVYLKFEEDGSITEEKDLSKVKDIFKIGDSLESIRLIKSEDDYKDLGILGEEQFQQVEMVHQLTQKMLYQDNIDLEECTRNMNLIIKDSKFLERITDSVLQKRARKQVMDLINVVTKEEIKDIMYQIYDNARGESGIEDIKREEDFKEFNKNLYDYEYGNNDDNREI